MRQGVFESSHPYAPDMPARLDQIAGAGFKLVLNYLTNSGTIAQLTAYLDALHQRGLGVIVNVGDHEFIDGSNATREHPDMAASFTHPATDTASYLTALASAIGGHPAVAGWFLSDEPETIPASAASQDAVAANVARNRKLIKAHSAAPQLVVIGGQNPYAFTAAALSRYASHCDIIAADFYPYGYPNGDFTVDETAHVASLVADAARHAGKRPAFVCQAFPWLHYKPTDAAGTMPDEATMRQMRDLALQGLGTTPAMILWFSYFDITQTTDPAGNFAALTQAAFT